MPTTIKQALKKWEEATGKKGSEATEVKLIGVYPPIEKVRLSWFLAIKSTKYIRQIRSLENFLY